MNDENPNRPQFKVMEDPARAVELLQMASVLLGDLGKKSSKCKTLEEAIEKFLE